MRRLSQRTELATRRDFANFCIFQTEVLQHHIRVNHFHLHLNCAKLAELKIYTLFRDLNWRKELEKRK